MKLVQTARTAIKIASVLTLDAEPALKATVAAGVTAVVGAAVGELVVASAVVGAVTPAARFDGTSKPGVF